METLTYLTTHTDMQPHTQALLIGNEPEYEAAYQYH